MNKQQKKGTLKKWLFISAVAIVAAASLFLRSFHRLPNVANKALDQSAIFRIYSLEPTKYEGDKNLNLLQGYPILGQTVVSNDFDRKGIVKEFREGVRNGRNYYIRCFEPRHGIRVESAGIRIDFVICFECEHVHIHKDRNSSYVRRSIVG